MRIYQLNEAIEVIDRMTWDVKNGTWSVNQFDYVRDLVDSLEATRDALAELRYIREENDQEVGDGFAKPLSPADPQPAGWERWASETLRNKLGRIGHDEPCFEDNDDCA